MKKLTFLTIFLIMALAGNAFAADSTCTVVEHENFLRGTGYVVVTLTADSSGEFNSIVNTITHANMSGIVEYATVEPGAVTPTASTDISIWSSTGKSLFGDTGRTAVPVNDGQLANIDFSTTRETLNVKRPVHGDTTIQVSNNSVNSAIIILHIYYSKDGFSGVAEPLDVNVKTASGDSVTVTSTAAAPIEYTETSLKTITVTAQSVAQNASYTPFTIDMSKIKGALGIQFQVAGAGTGSMSYAISNDGTNFFGPVTGIADEGAIFTGITATSGGGSRGVVIDDVDVEFAKWVKFYIDETAGSDAISVTATLAYR